LGQTSAGGVDPRVARECARRLQALANRSDAHPHNKDRRSTFGRQGSESEVSLDDKRTLLSRGNSKQSVESTASNRSRRSDRSAGSPHQTPHNDEAKSEPGSEGVLSPGEKPSLRTSLESRLDLFNTVLATHARKENESKKVQAELTGDGEPNACTIDPQSPFRIGWDLTTAIFLVYVAFWEPFNLGYVGECATLDISHAVFNKMMDAFFLVDLFVNFNTGFVTSDGEVVMCPKRSVKNYLWTWFPIDFVSSISPVLDYFIWWAARGAIVLPGPKWNGLSGPPNDCDGGANGLAMARLLKIGRIFKIFKVLRIAKLVKMGNDSAIAEFIDDFLMSSASKTAMKLINIVCFTAVFAHFMSCFFAACGLHAWEAYNPLEGTSLADGDYDLALDQAGEENRHRAKGPAGDWTRLRQYLVGLYWAITTISTVGYGDFVPVTDKERGYAILAMFIGSGFYGYVVAQAANIISNSDADQAKYYEKMDSVQVWMKHHRFPSHIRRRIRTYYRAYYSQRLCIDEQDLMSDLNPALKQTIAEFLLHELVVTHPIFAKLPEGLMSKFITLVRSTRAKLGEEIVVQGEESRSMFVISKGLAEVSIIDWDARTCSKAPLPEGESFGELCALNMIFVSDITVVAKTEPVELFVINLEDMGVALGKLESEDQESFASIKEAAAKLHARQMARWRRKPEPLPPPGADDEPPVAALSHSLASIPGSTPATPNTSRGEIELRPAGDTDQSPLSSLMERRSLEDFPATS
jgi:CRP-like cAMP-binding protein